ncbi:putative Na+/H+ antiporter [bacterium]|nr:putative Na+/H+ antiporter [bacterium]
MQIEHLGATFFAVALLHTFLVSYFAKLAKKFEKGSAAEAFFHLLSEVEVVFGFWAFLFLICWSLIDGIHPVIEYQQSLNMTEPLFIFCIMIVASTRPVVTVARQFILLCSGTLLKVFKINPVMAQFSVLLILGPLLGSLITEPAAITITALLLYRMLDKNLDSSLLYPLIALLFVNISVGGALTHFAAPPILVVARTWGWSLSDVFIMLGEASIAAVVLNTLIFALIYRKKIVQMLMPIEVDQYPMPKWVSLSHLVFLAAIVATSHYTQVSFGIFLIFVGLVTVTKNYQDQLKFKEGFLVAFFLSGLIVFGSFQRWWLEPLILGLNNVALYLGAIGLTAVTDNAALTYLGSQVPNLSDLSKWALVSGALVGGGLTILANAPNPAGFSILSSKFENSSLNAFKLFKAALLPTFIAMLCFYIKIFILAQF